MTAPKLSNTKRSLDINSIPHTEIETVPDFIRAKMYQSEEFSNRKRADEMLGAGKVKGFRPKAVGEPVIEYPAEDTNPDDVPF